MQAELRDESSLVAPRHVQVFSLGIFISPSISPFTVSVCLSLSISLIKFVSCVRLETLDNWKEDDNDQDWWTGSAVEVYLCTCRWVPW